MTFRATGIAPWTACLNALLVAGLVTACPARAAVAETLIPYEKFSLDNGLTVIVHTDRKAPVVAVNLWYHVGSKNEQDGKTGFAHLFEHLMFQGSEHYDDEYFKPFEDVGATGQNGTTSFDRTNYFQNVPTTALDLALWMESDRMGHLLGVITQERLDEQRGVVQNEKRQGENRPQGRVWETVMRASFPVGHPYHWLPIGSMEDLNAASLDDVKEWFRTYYGAANAVLVLAGDIDVATARAKAERYFGHIPAGPALTRPGQWIAARSESRREVLFDPVAQPYWYRFWNIPPEGTADADLLGIAGYILGGGKTSRLYERLVYRERLADSANAGPSTFEIAGIFTMTAAVKSGIDPSRVEAAMQDELQRFIAQGPTREEMERARTALRADFLKGLERIGGFGGKADVLASCEVYMGDPGCYRRSLDLLRTASAEQVRAAAERWLSRGDYTLEVQPYPKYQNAAASAVDRTSGVPAVTSFPALAFPDLQRFTLRNGMPVVIATRPGVPVARVSALFDAGFAADRGRAPGTASFTMGLLDEGTQRLDALAIAARAESLGADLMAGSSLDTSFGAVSALTEHLDPSIALLADVLRNPAFPDAEIERVRKEWIAAIGREKTSPDALANRLLPPLIYGDGHPYAIPFTGSGTEASVAALTRDDLVAFHRDWIRPDNATLIVVGDTRPADVLPILEKHFGDWQAPSGAGPTKTMPVASAMTAPRVFLVDKPGAVQSNILVGLAAPSSVAPNRLEMDTMNAVLAGTFTSRVNMNLREEKHWSYGARSSLADARGQRPWLLSAPVQTDKTGESMREIQREVMEFVGERPATADEVAKVRNRDVRALSGRYETNAAVAGAIAELITFARPDDYVRTLKDRIEAQTVDGVRAAAREALDPARLTWVVIGDLAKIEQPIRDLQLGTVQVVDVDGKPVR
ncbi:MAG: insulinase family protein [Steroidobacteraceae bacterium]|nr:insulinase family protein [Steroidobacteraceae bacterium]